MQQNGYLQDSHGNKSSKRLWGSILLLTGITFSGLLFMHSLHTKVADTPTTLSIINMFLISGGSLLGIGVFERKIISSNNNKNNN